MLGMILLISPYQNAPECASAIEAAVHEQVKTVNTLRLAQAALRADEFSTVVADENLLECAPGSLDALVNRMGIAVPVIVDMACLRPAGVAKHVVIANRRRKVEHNLVRQQAVEELRSELRNELTGLLLTSEIALKSFDDPAIAKQKLVSVLEIAGRIQKTLQ